MAAEGRRMGHGSCLDRKDERVTVAEENAIHDTAEKEANAHFTMWLRFTGAG